MGNIINGPLASIISQVNPVLLVDGNGNAVIFGTGTGTGNVVGAAVSAMGDIATYNGTTGKIIKDSSYNIGTNGALSSDNSSATGADSVSLGNSNNSYAANSFSMGLSSIASGVQSVALGTSSKALHANSMTLCDASGSTSTRINQATMSFGNGLVLASGTELVLTDTHNVTWQINVTTSGTLTVTSY